MILWYLSFSWLKSSPKPVPIAVIKATISSCSSIFSGLAFSTFRILPLKGKIAWKFLSLPCFAEPPAESPSTIYSSDLLGSFSEQSANFPGREPPSRAFFLIIKSLAFLAASLALADVSDLFNIFFASSGLSYKNSLNRLPIICSTAPLTSGFPSLPFVCPSN